MSLSKHIEINGKQITVPLTIADRVVDYFNPKAGSQRYQSRLRMALSGGYDAADKTRRANQKGSRREMDADAAIIPDLITLREESQNMLRNSPIASGAINTNVTKVVGTGLKVQPQIRRKILGLTADQADAWQQQAEQEFLLATETREFDIERQLTFSLMQGLIFRKVLEDGDLLVNMPRIKRSGSPYKVKLQLIEAARLCNKDGSQDTDTLIAGVKKDKSTGAPELYQVASKHPGGRRFWRNKTDVTWTELKAFGQRSGDPMALLLYDKLRPGQSRGVPYLAPVVEMIKQLGRYTHAEVMAAVVSGMLTVFVTTESGNSRLGPAPTQSNTTGDPDNQDDDSGMELGYGSVVGLQPNEKIESVNPGRPNPAFDPFMQAVLRQIGVALELPFELLIKHFTASYSAARAAMLEAWSYFNRRRHWLIVSFCQPVYEAVITEAVATGRLKAPGFFSDPMVRRAWLGTTWIGDAAGQIDPLKEINAAAKRVEMTISTLEEESRKFTGTPWENKLEQVLKERRILRENGIAISEKEIDQDQTPPGSDREDL